MQQLRYELKTHARCIDALRAVQSAALPQFYDLASLQKRWALGRDSVLAALSKHIRYHGMRGKPVRIPLDQVLAIDEALRAEVSHA
jgi:hypothetical protein